MNSETMETRQKKAYEAPVQDVYEMNVRQALLAGSDNGGTLDDGGDGEGGGY